MRVAACVVLLVSLGACRHFMTGRARCAETLPILRVEPSRDYRVIKIVEADGEDDLAWKACAEGADALLMQGESGETVTRMRWGKISTRERVFLRGAAIRYVGGQH